jgi:hypothetical protein
VEGVLLEQRVQLAEQRRALRRALLQLGVLQLRLQRRRQADGVRHLRRMGQQVAVGVPEGPARAGGGLQHGQREPHVPRRAAREELLAHVLPQVARRLPHGVGLPDEAVDDARAVSAEADVQRHAEQQVARLDLLRGHQAAPTRGGALQPDRGGVEARRALQQLVEDGLRRVVERRRRRRAHVRRRGQAHGAAEREGGAEQREHMAEVVGFFFGLVFLAGKIVIRRADSVAVSPCLNHGRHCLVLRRGPPRLSPSSP